MGLVYVLFIYVERLAAAVSCVVLRSCFGGMTSEQADVAVLDITLRRMDFYSLRSCGADAESRPGILETICNCLVLIPHWQEVDQLDRLTLFRLADVLYLSWTGSWETLPSSGEDKTKMRHVVCFVPQRDTSHWDRAIEKWEQTADQMDEAAAHLNAFLASLPRVYDGTGSRELNWIERGCTLLSSGARELRNQGVSRAGRKFHQECQEHASRQG